MTTISDISIESSHELVRDKRGLGLLLISLSSFASVVIVGVVVTYISFSVLGSSSEMTAEDLENFSTAAGSENPVMSPQK